jgi:hypothetical protein
MRYWWLFELARRQWRRYWKRESIRRPLLLAVLAASLVYAYGSMFGAWTSPAAAGTGPDGFARYARQGIVNYDNRIYGKGNSPWKVTCTDHPNYTTMSDRVVCRVTLKNP